MLPPIISFPRYTFGAAEARFEELGYVCIFLFDAYPVLLCLILVQHRIRIKKENTDIT